MCRCRASEGVRAPSVASRPKGPHLEQQRSGGDPAGLCPRQRTFHDRIFSLPPPPAPRPAPRRAGIQRASGSQGVNLHPVARGWLFGGVLGGVALEVAGKRADKIRSFLAKFGGGVGRGPPSSPAAPPRSPSSLRPQLRRRRWTARCRCGRPGGCAQARAGGPGSRAGRATSMRGPPTTGRPARRWRRRPRASPTTASDAGASEPPEPRRRRPPRRDWPPARRPRCTRATPRP